MKKNIRHILPIILVIHLLSCEKFVEIDPPKNKLISTTVFRSDDTGNAALLTIYSNMFNPTVNTYIMSLYPGLSSDELRTYATDGSYQQLYKNALMPIDGVTKAIWTGGFNCIYGANAIIEGCNSPNNLSAQVKKQLYGEALFIRAFWNFYLVNYFGDIPLVLTTDYQTNGTLSRTALNAVYNQIVADLIAAQNNLTDNYVAADGIKSSTERIRVNKNVATAFLARVYLYMNKYADAEAQSSILIANKETYDTVDINAVFLKNSKEAIWQIMPPSNTTFNTTEGFYFPLTSVPKTGLNNSNTISESLLNTFEPGDNRKIAWIGKFTDTTVTPNKDYYYPNKYKNNGNGSLTEYALVMRIAEQYLIRAEARAQTGNLSGAIDDIDVIRNRAGLPLIGNLNPGISKDSLLTAIWKEKYVELFTEWGHRWLDLKRTGKINEVMSHEAVAKGSTWKSTSQLYPIPQSEIDNDNKLKQNEGYN